MIGKQAQEQMKKGANLYKQAKLLEALEVLENLLKISPEYNEALNLKAHILKELKKYEDQFQKAFNSNLQKLKMDGEIPLDVKSPDPWIEEAIKLINNGKNDRALMCMEQASYVSPIVNSEGLSSMTHHNNAKIYYFIGIILFNKQDKYDLAMSLFEKANKLDPTFTIPDKIKDKYNEYLSNRSGVGVKMIAPLNASNLRALIPSRDKILVSTSGYAEADVPDGKGVNHYGWETHMLLTNYGLAFKVVSPVCNQPEYYVAWPFITYDKRWKNFKVSYRVGGLNYSVSLKAWNNPHPKSGEGKYEYMDELNLKHLIEVAKEEMIKRTIIKLKNSGYLPSYKGYLYSFDKVTKPIYKSAIKTIKQSKGKS